MHHADARDFSSPRRLDLRLVHRTSDDQVFLTDFKEAGPFRWLCAVDIPMSHPRMRTRADEALPLLVALELQRQGGYVSAHAQGIPIGWRFVILRFGVRWNAGGPRVMTTEGFHGALEIRSRVIRSWGGKPRLIEFDFALRNSGNRLVASGRGLTLCLEPSRYAAIRTRNQPDQGRPQSRTSQAKLIEVRWDIQDRFLFNRPDDHVVSMALLDAFLTHLDTAFPLARAQGIDAEFFAFGSASRPIWMDVTHATPANRVQVSFIQDNSVIATASALIALSPLPVSASPGRRCMEL
jgi:hypothetical protein